MKKLHAFLIGITSCTLALGSFATLPATARAADAADGADAWQYEILAPQPYDMLLGDVTDISYADGVTAIVVGGRVHIYDDRADATVRHTDLGISDAVSVSVGRGGTVAAVDESGAVTAGGKAVAVEGALDVAFTTQYLAVLTGEGVTFCPYTDAAVGDPVGTAAMEGALCLASDVSDTENNTVYALASQQSATSPFLFYGASIRTDANGQPAPATETLATRSDREIFDIAYADSTIYYVTGDQTLRSYHWGDAVSPDNAVVEIPSNGAYRDGAMPDLKRVALCGDRLLLAGDPDGAVLVNAYALGAERPAFERSVVVGEDNAIGSFKKPSASIPYGEGILVADTENDRVQYLTADGVSLVGDEKTPFDRPYVLASSGDGSLYVADQSGKRLTVWAERDGAWICKESRTFGNITDLVLRGDNTLLVADEGELRPLGGGTLIADNAVRAVADETTHAVYCLTTYGDLQRISANGEITTIVEKDKALLDFDVDADGTIYAITATEIRTFRPNGTGYTAKTHALTGDYAVGELVDITIADESDNGLVECGTLLLTSSSASVLRTVAPEIGGAAVKDWSNYSDPIDIGAAYPSDRPWYLAETTRQTALSSYPSVHTTKRTLPSGTKLFVLAEECESEYFVQVAVELDGAAHDTPDFIGGYLLKSDFAKLDTEPYHPYTHGYVKIETYVYKYPSVASAHLTEKLRFDKDTPVNLDLVAMPSYTDTLDNNWVAVKVEGGIGYVPAGRVMRKNYADVTEPIDTNATIRTNLSSGIEVFVLSPKGEYETLPDIRLIDGSRVQIVGEYDAGAEYTHVYYVDENGLLDCYVKTSALDRDGLGTVEAVAVSLIILTLVIGAVVFCVRRKNRMY